MITIPIRSSDPDLGKTKMIHPNLNKLRDRRLADDTLFNISSLPGYCMFVLRQVANPSVDQRIRQCAPVNLNNHLETRWLSGNPIHGDEKILFIQQVVNSIMYLGETLHIIGKYDFQSLCPELFTHLNSSLEHALKDKDFISVISILFTFNSLFEKFSYELETDDVMRDFEYCLDNFAAPLLTTVKALSDPDVVVDNASIPHMIKAQTLCCRIFNTLNHLDFPRVFKTNADMWIILFKSYLTNTRYADFGNDDHADLALVDELRAAACDNITLFMVMDDSLLRNYMTDLFSAVWDLLVVLSPSPTRTPLAVASLRFLKIFNRSPSLRVSISSDESLQQIIQCFVFPNVMVRAEHEDMFNINYADFILDEFDLRSRRMIACHLLQEIARNYKKEEVTGKVLAQIHKFLDLFDENSDTNWKYLDCVIYLLSSVATTTGLYDVVDVDQFFTSCIVPQLQASDVNEFPMLKASALRFLTTFRIRISKHIILDCLDDVVRFLNSDVNVVHSYAATCIEMLLFVRDNKLQARYTSSDIAQILPVLMKRLFDALEKPKSEDNEYIMKCIVRVLQVADITHEVASLCIAWLPKVLDTVRYKNPKSSPFNCFLFMAIYTLVPRACEKNLDLSPVFEECLLPSLQSVLLAENETELVPYALRLFDQLVDLNRTAFTSHYMQIFDKILWSLDFLKNSANVPIPLHLLLSFLKQLPPNELNREGRLSHVLTVFDHIVSSPRKDGQCFDILKPIIENLGYDVIAEHMNRIWASLFNLLQTSGDPTLVTCLIEFMSIFLVKHGSQNLVDSLSSVQADKFLAFLGEYWIPNLMTITGYTEVKLSAVVSSMLLCKSTSLLDPAAEELWGKLLDGIVTLLSWLDCQEPTVVCLHNAAAKDDPFTDPKCYIVSLLANLSSLFSERFPSVITKYLSLDNQISLFQLCDFYNHVIV